MVLEAGLAMNQCQRLKMMINITTPGSSLTLSTLVLTADGEFNVSSAGGTFFSSILALFGFDRTAVVEEGYGVKR